mmetsp:Transcript_34408/g.111066  ORF Transcript_34408/g.111066 Transcript_34408/m.111066 type:complete len:207 (-) Transcript_34408:316-936(-)
MSGWRRRASARTRSPTRSLQCARTCRARRPRLCRSWSSQPRRGTFTSWICGSRQSHCRDASLPSSVRRARSRKCQAGSGTRWVQSRGGSRLNTLIRMRQHRKSATRSSAIARPWEASTPPSQSTPFAIIRRGVRLRQAAVTESSTCGTVRRRSVSVNFRGTAPPCRPSTFPQTARTSPSQLPTPLSAGTSSTRRMPSTCVASSMPT